MVSACKSYITEGDLYKVWDVDPRTLLKRFQDCRNLYKHYQDSFQHSKERAQKASRQYEVSEMYVFGKFGSFCRRLMRIQDTIELIQQFGVLKLSRIEGIDTFANRFSQIVSFIKKKPYNPLDHRKQEFVADFQDFQRQISELEDQLVSFMIGVFNQIQSSTLQSLKLLER